MRLVVGLSATIAEQSDTSRRSHAAEPSRCVALSESRVVFNCHALALVKRHAPGISLRTSGNKHAVFGKFGLHHAPFKALKATHTAANQQFRMADAQMLGEQLVRTHHVANRHHRKIAIPWLASGRVDFGGAGSAVARAQYIGAHHKVFVGVEKAPSLHRSGPPVSHIAVGSKRMTHPRHIAAVVVQPAESMVSHLQRRQNFPTLQRKLFIIYKNVTHIILLNIRKITNNYPIMQI